MRGPINDFNTNLSTCFTELKFLMTNLLDFYENSVEIYVFLVLLKCVKGFELIKRQEPF